MKVRVVYSAAHRLGRGFDVRAVRRPVMAYGRVGRFYDRLMKYGLDKKYQVRVNPQHLVEAVA